MVLFSKNKITHRLAFSYLILIILFAGSGTLAWFEVGGITALTRSIYNHPLVVSNAALRCSLYVAKMQKNIEDVALFATSKIDTGSLVDLAQNERKALDQLDLIQQKILGDNGRSLEHEARKMLLQWEPIRQEIISLLQKGNRDPAVYLAKSKSAGQAEMLESKMMEIAQYARLKAATFIQGAEKADAWAKLIVPPFLLTGLGIVVLVAMFTLRRTEAMERVILAERDRNRQYFDIAGSIMVVINADQTVARINKAGCRTLGLAQEQIVGRNWFDHFIPEPEREKIRGCFADLTDEKMAAPDSFENHVLAEDGRERLIAWHNTVIRDDNGRITATLSSGIDITEDKRAQASLKTIEWLLRTPAPDLRPAPTHGDLTENNTKRLLLDGVGRTVLDRIAGGYLDLLGTSAAIYESNGDYACDLITSGWCQKLNAASRALCNTEDNILAMASGRWLCHESCWTHTSRKAVQSAGPVDVECYGGLRIYAIPILAGEEIVGSINFGYGAPPRDMNKLQEIARRYQVDIDELIQMTDVYESRPPFIVEIAKKRLTSSAMVLGAMVQSAQAENALIREKNKLAVTLHSIGDGVITTDVFGKVTLINTVAEKLTGWAELDALGQPLRDVFHIINEKTRRLCENPVEKVLETKGIIGLANDTVLVARDGTERVIADSGAPIVDEQGETIGVVLVFRDITEKIDLEAELRHAHKMEAIGTLAGGIAHEFNNVLGIIIGNAELAMDDLPSWSPTGQNLTEIKLASLRAKDVVKQLLNFSRKMDVRPEPIDVRIIVKEALKLLRASIPAGIEIQQIIPEEVDTVMADSTQIHQLLINLCNNAAQAMDNEQGTLSIELKNVLLNFEQACKHPDLKPGPYVRFSVSDTGCGIPSNMLDKIFDPYFTTKDVGKGTGLGLAVVHGIVKTHNGAIQVESTEGRGTAFHVYFPACNDELIKKQTKADALVGGSERILFVDDEPAICKMNAMILSRLGYRVTAKSDPAKALELFKRNPHDYDLVISDMTMPAISGEQLAEKLLGIRSGLPIILCTGDSEKITSEQICKIGIQGYLTKPMVKADLAKLIRRLLDEQASPS